MEFYCGKGVVRGRRGAAAEICLALDAGAWIPAAAPYMPVPAVRATAQGSGQGCLAAMRGPQGPQGPQGSQGSQGCISSTLNFHILPLV